MVSLWFRLTLGMMPFSAAGLSEGSTAPAKMAFLVIGTDDHQTRRAEVTTLGVADLGEIEQRGCDRRPG